MEPSTTPASTSLAPPAYLDHLRRDAARMALLAEDGLDVEVPTCAGWKVRDVIAHTGQVYLHKVANMRTMAAVEFPPEEPGPELVPWFRTSLQTLVAELEARGPHRPSYTWYPGDQTVGFWYRRMAQETAVHRVDVESAFDAVTPVEDALAVDGIDEVLIRFLDDDWSESPVAEAAGSIIAVRTGEHAWQVSLEPDRVSVRSGPGSADATVTGEASELLLWLWGRRPDAAVQVTGEAAAAAALRRRLRIVTQ